MSLTQPDIQKLREDFPILKEKIYGKKLIYFDNAATTHKPLQVLQKIEFAYNHQNSNIHRGVHYLSRKATEAHEEARETVARYINAPKKEEVIFTKGTTEAINLVAFSFGEAFCNEGDEVIITAMEHHANIVPWQMLCERKKMKLRVLPITDKGELQMNQLDSMLNDKTKIVAVMHASNVLGTINPIEEIIQKAHALNISVLVDGAQAVPHTEVDVQQLDADFYVFSGHKMYGPTGIGVLYGKEKWLNQMPPYQGGGEMIEKVSFEKTTYNVIPFKFEAGTPDYIASTALAEALRYIENIGIDKIAAYENELTQYAIQQLSAIEGLRFYGEAENRSSVISFLIGDIHPYDIGMLLDRMGIAMRTGHHCAQPLIDYFGIPGTLRISFSFYNTFEEIDYFVESLKKVMKMLNVC